MTLNRVESTAVACVVAMTVAAPGVALAANGFSSQAGDVFFPWVKSGGFRDNWLEGLGFFGLGILGALVTVYLLLGDFLPSMGGKAEYEELKLELADLTQRRDKQLQIRERFSRGDGPAITDEQLAAADKLTGDLSIAIGQKETELRNRKRSLQALGLPLYVLLGGGFAVLFATTELQAILIGFGWTALADRIGLGKELNAKTSTREQEVQKLREGAERGVTAQGELEAARAQIKQL
jgi:hypothetical protein